MVHRAMCLYVAGGQGRQGQRGLPGRLLAEEPADYSKTLLQPPKFT